jgi:hypothetical protein
MATSINDSLKPIGPTSNKRRMGYQKLFEINELVHVLRTIGALKENRKPWRKLLPSAFLLVDLLLSFGAMLESMIDTHLGQLPMWLLICHSCGTSGFTLV